MATKGASDRWNSCQVVVASWRQHREMCSDRLIESLGQGLPPEVTAPDPRELVDPMVDQLETLGLNMVSTDQKHLDEVGDDPEYRERRGDAQSGLNSRYIRQRGIFTDTYGEALARKVGFESTVEENPDRLVLQVERVQENLLSPDLELPDAPISGVQIDPEAFAKGFDPELSSLRSAISDLVRESREAEAKLIAKQAARDLYDRWFLAVAQVLVSLYKLAGMDEEALRVRPSLRRPGRRAEEAEAGRQEDEDPTSPPSDSTPPEGSPGEAPAAQPSEQAD